MKELAGYTLVERLGTGGMAEAWLARGHEGGLVVLKRILPKLAHDPQVQGRFVRVAALVLMPPILLNTEVGIRSIDPTVRDAARGMGMTGWQALWRVEVPLATPLILAGFRSATGQVIATATIAAFVGLGGLGRFIIDGSAISVEDPRIFAGALFVAVMALLVEGSLALVQKFVLKKYPTKGSIG